MALIVFVAEVKVCMCVMNLLCVIVVAAHSVLHYAEHQRGTKVPPTSQWQDSEKTGEVWMY